MKRKQPGQRARAKRTRDDDALLRKYARHEYDATRDRIAKKAGVRRVLIKNKQGHARAINAGLSALRAWFKGLPVSQQPLARAQMRSAIESGISGVPESVDDEVIKANQPHVDELIAKAKAAQGGGFEGIDRGVADERLADAKQQLDGELDTDTELHAVESGGR